MDFKIKKSVEFFQGELLVEHGNGRVFVPYKYDCIYNTLYVGSLLSDCFEDELTKLFPKLKDIKDYEN